MLLSRVLQIVTLQLHGLKGDPTQQQQQQQQQQQGKDCGAPGGTEESKSGGVGSGSAGYDVDEAAYLAAVLLEERPATPLSGEDAAAAQRQKGDTGGGGSGHGSGSSLDASWIMAEGVVADSSPGGGSDAGGGTASICEMLGRVARHHGTLGTLFEDGLQWIVRELARRSPACRDVLDRLGVLPRPAEEATAAAAADDGGAASGRAGGGESGGTGSKLAAASGSSAAGGGRGAGAATLAEKKKKAQVGCGVGGGYGEVAVE